MDFVSNLETRVPVGPWTTRTLYFLLPLFVLGKRGVGSRSTRMQLIVYESIQNLVYTILVNIEIQFVHTIGTELSCIDTEMEVKH